MTTQGAKQTGGTKGLATGTRLGRARYPDEAVEFVKDGLAFTVDRAFPDSPSDDLGGGAPGNDRHVSGQQLCLGLRELALERWGWMTPVVLRKWGIARTDDFGRIVFSLVEAGKLAATPGDSIEDFRSVYDFAEVFDKPHLRERLGNRASAPRDPSN